MHRTTPICLAASLAMFCAGTSQAEFQFQLTNLAQTEGDTWSVDLQVQASEPMPGISYLWFDASISGTPLATSDVGYGDIGDGGYLMANQVETDGSVVTTIGFAALADEDAFEATSSWQTLANLSFVLPDPSSGESALTIGNFRAAFETDLNQDGMANILDFIQGFEPGWEIWTTIGPLEGSASLTIPAPATLALLAGGLGGFRRRRAG